MDKFLKYFENEKFVRWVIAPDKQLNDYWNYYVNTHSAEKGEIELARLIITQLQSKEESKADSEAIHIFYGILRKLEQKKKKSRVRVMAFNVAKYAAVGLLCFSLGMAVLYYHNSDQLNEIAEQMVVAQDKNNSQLLLADGNSVSISEKKSEIEYQLNGNIVINRQDTVGAVNNSERLKLNQLVVPYGKNSSIKLPDGTMAYINAGSRLVYPSVFEGKNREVYLFGEGYFEVTHNQAMPFIVKTNEIDVEVLGTKFNLSAYPSDNFIETVLVEGKVKVKEVGFQLKRNNYILEPNQRCSFSKESSKAIIHKVDVSNYISWHEGYLNFEALELNRVIKKMERYYDINIELSDPMLGLHKISGKLKLQDDDEAAMTVLVTVASAELIKINNRNYVIK
jgi:hypothetical protein